MFYNKQVELWQKGERVNIGGGIFKDGVPTLIKAMLVDIQPYSKEEALKDYGYTVDCTNIMFCNVENVRIDKTFIKYNGHDYGVKKIVEWDSYLEIILNRM